MKTSIFPFVAAGAVLGVSAAFGSIRSSADYAVATETAGPGGAFAASASYSVNAAVSGAGAVASSGSCVVKGGFAGQLFDVAGLVPTAGSSSVNEGATLPLGVAWCLDDATLLPLAPSLAAWSVVSGPVGAIDANGVLTAGNVGGDTPATVRASYRGFTGTLSLTVADADPDNFGSYAADGLPDEWQIEHFGNDNPNAAPQKDVFGAGQTNFFKYVAGLDPADRTSVFRVAVQPVSGQPGRKQIVFGPVLPDRTYTVVFKSNLTESTWTPLTGATQSDNGRQRTVTDPDAGGKAKFYRVQIGKP